MTGESWIAAAGEYALYNNGAWLGDVPTPRLVEIAYFLVKREILSGVVEKEVSRARDRAMSRLDGTLQTSGDDDETGLPAWVTSSGVGPADGSSPFDF